MNNVLLLNANASPVNWLPLSCISWQNAIRLLWLDVVDVLHTYDNWFVHSPSTTIEVPSVVMLRKHVGGFRSWIARDDAPQSHLVFLRDNFICQYCLKQFSRRQLTMDHVTPKRYGGLSHYSNLTSACSPCNSRRGCDYRIRPASKPYIPTMGLLIKNMRKFPIVIPDMTWNLYLNWDEKQVRLTQRLNKIELNEDFEPENEEYIIQ